MHDYIIRLYISDYISSNMIKKLIIELSKL